MKRFQHDKTESYSVRKVSVLAKTTLILLLLLFTPAMGQTKPVSHPLSSEQQSTQSPTIKLPSPGATLITILAIEILVIMASDETKGTLAGQLHPNNLLVNLIKQYATHEMATMLHEVGHAVAAHLITGQPATIYLGAHGKKKTFIDFGPIKITGLDPVAGSTTYTSPIGQRANELVKIVIDYCVAKNLDPATLTEQEWQAVIEDWTNNEGKSITGRPKLKEAIILLAGGCTAIICHLLIKALAVWATGRGKKDILTIDPIVAQQLLTMLWPIKINDTTLSDGGKLWQNCLGVNPQVVQAASSSALAVDFATEIALTYKMSEGQRPPAIDLLAVAVLNFMLRGYLRFSL